MYVLCLIDFEQTVGLSWVCFLTFHIFRLFLIFLALFIYLQQIIWAGLFVHEKRGAGPRPAFFCIFLFVFIFDCFFTHVLAGHIR